MKLSEEQIKYLLKCIKEGKFTCPEVRSCKECMFGIRNDKDVDCMIICCDEIK